MNLKLAINNNQQKLILSWIPLPLKSKKLSTDKNQGNFSVISISIDQIETAEI